MYGLRNRIVHDYGNVDLNIVFETLKNDIPELLEIDVYKRQAQIRTEYLENQKNEKTYMMDGISLEKEQPEKEN